MTIYHGLAAVAAPLVRHARYNRNYDAQRCAIAKRELATPTHIPGDDTQEEIDRKFTEALRWGRWRSREQRSA